jgi:hypothetical protein
MGKSTDFNGAAESRVRCKPARAGTGKITPELRLRTLGGQCGLQCLVRSQIVRSAGLHRYRKQSGKRLLFSWVVPRV